MDGLYIKALSVATRIGAFAWEQQISQPLLIDISIPADFSRCNDELSNTIDYAKLCQLVTSYVESNAFHLIETVADHVAHLVKKEFNLNEVSISVSKPHAIKNAANVQVTVTR